MAHLSLFLVFPCCVVGAAAQSSERGRCVLLLWAVVFPWGAGLGVLCRMGSGFPGKLLLGVMRRAQGPRAGRWGCEVQAVVLPGVRRVVHVLGLSK